MIVIKIGIVICSLFIKYSESIDLILPLSEEDAEHFHVTKTFVSLSHGQEYLFNVIYYESLPNDLIRRVVFHGVDLIDDKDDHPPGFRRFVTYGSWNNRVLIGISRRESGISIPEIMIGFTADLIGNLLESPSLNSFVRDYPDTVISKFISSLSSETQDPKNIINDEMDLADEEPYLMKGNTNISAEEIEKEVQNIMQKNSSTPDDQAVPGPSGITQHLNLRSEKKDDTSDEDMNLSD